MGVSKGGKPLSTGFLAPPLYRVYRPEIPTLDLQNRKGTKEERPIPNPRYGGRIPITKCDQKNHRPSHLSK
jgi:hypothetical protein